MHVSNIIPKKEYNTLEDLVAEAIGEPAELEANKSYEIYNNGGCATNIIVQPAEPEEPDIVGRILLPGHAYTYVNGGTNKCFIKASDACDLHIEVVE